MLPTPDTRHVPYSRVYEPAEDSFLLLDTLSSPSETAFLQSAFPPTSPAPLVLEVGTGSGVVVAFVNAHARALFGHRRLLTCGVDVNAFACRATVRTVAKAAAANAGAGDRDARGRGGRGGRPPGLGRGELPAEPGNRPEDVAGRVAALGGGWRADVVGGSGKTAGWEKLCVLRIWRGAV
ncbi:methyltransferase [Metarhizium album ARSEF 1941]|uniref:Methyltransferase n=1 Tax=Metarhizium album (strain ARSEF 1941) TaxID=1081103 RepID=A0A0B2WSJ6_METAS|nr:methyltransferase [Metarhizium album ARSEF 1941]KHN96457.1 methyltransferase [Metarhizium album ARSEF 1941]